MDGRSGSVTAATLLSDEQKRNGTSRNRPDTPARRTWILPDGRIAFVALAPSYTSLQQVVGYDAARDVVVALDLKTLEEAAPDRPRC